MSKMLIVNVKDVNVTANVNNAEIKCMVKVYVYQIDKIDCVNNIGIFYKLNKNVQKTLAVNTYNRNTYNMKYKIFLAVKLNISR